MDAHPPVEVCIRWDVFNLLYRRLARRGVPTEVIRYEDYVADVDGALRACMALCGRSYLPASGLAVGHGIAGNPSRFAVEGARVERDDRWLHQMGATRHLLVSGLTWPTRLTYGYSSSRRVRSARSRYPHAGRSAGAPGGESSRRLQVTQRD